MGKRATFSQATLTKAIKAAKAAGLAVNRCEIGPDGSIILSAIEGDWMTTASAYDDWKASQK